MIHRKKSRIIGGVVNFFRRGKRIENAELRIYDATGNVVNKVKITDKALDSQVRRRGRQLGSDGQERV